MNAVPFWPATLSVSAVFPTPTDGRPFTMGPRLTRITPILAAFPGPTIEWSADASGIAPAVPFWPWKA
jgi:hypothetical protein